MRFRGADYGRTAFRVAGLRVWRPCSAHISIETTQDGQGALVFFIDINHPVATFGGADSGADQWRLIMSVRKQHA